MNAELDNALCRDFPLLYVDRHAPMNRTAMCWGFDVPDSWEPTIRRLSEKLEALIAQYIKDNPDDEYRPCASQVKEKWGTLRFYMSGQTEEMSQAISEAEREICRLEGIEYE